MSPPENRLSPDGGRLAARGFQYQYLRTLEWMLSRVDDPQVSEIRVEGPLSRSGVEVDSVDFDVLDSDGNCGLAVQVKSKLPMGSIGAGEIFDVLMGLTRARAASYKLLTNGRPTSTARELAAVLLDDNQKARITDALTHVLPARRAQLASLGDEQADRILRCEVLFDERDDVQIRESIRETLRAYRSRTKTGLGERSAGMLTGYLVSEVLRRAADSGEATFTIEQLRDHILISPEDMARAGGSRDWGIVVGSMPPLPDVARPVLLEKLNNYLNESLLGGVSQVILAGPSGIGKSSMAAAHVADRADSYDFIFWIDSESEQSILASFRHIASYLHLVDGGMSHQGAGEDVRRAVHAELSRLPGPWLAIFDNVRSQRSIHKWIPYVGRGRIMATSIDSGSPYGAATVIEVGVMGESESVNLLSRRLGLTQEECRSFHAELLELADGMSHWPLALELASGYIYTCGIPLGDVGYYLNQLRVQSLADPGSLPPGYPQTLYAALWLSIATMRDRNRVEPNARTYIALNMLFNASFLGSRQLPCHMIAAPAPAFEWDDSIAGTTLVDSSAVNLGEAVRELRRFSLVRFDEPLRRIDGQALADAGYTIAVNEIVQEVVRSELERTYDASDMESNLNRLAFHTQRWFTVALDLNLLERAAILFVHADTLARHLRRIGINGKNVALLYGNLAGAQKAAGEVAKAVDLLQAELELTERAGKEDLLLTIQAKLSLLDCVLAEGEDNTAGWAKAMRYCEDIAQYAYDIGISYPNAAVKFAVDLNSVIDQARLRIPDLDEMSDIQTRLSALVLKFGPTQYSENAYALKMANFFLSNGKRLSAVESLCVRILSSGSTIGSTELEARRLLVEALVRQHKWTEARAQHLEYSGLFGASSFHLRIVGQYIHNVGIHCSTVMLMDGESDPQALAMLSDLVDWFIVPTVLSQASGPMRSRVRLLIAIRDMLVGRDAEEFFSAVRPADLQEGSYEETGGWCMHWQVARLMAFRIGSASSLVGRSQVLPTKQ